MKNAGRGSFGPGFLITAAFIGPGTVTTCSMAGAGFGYALIYVLVFAVVATIILQEMSGRLALASRLDLGRALREFPRSAGTRILYALLTFLSITFGCAVYEAGNIIGGSLGMEVVTGISREYWVIFITLAAALILSRGKYQWVEKFLIAMVFVMSVSFLATAIILKPDMGSIMKGFVPSFPPDSLYLILALVGTTVVPYNLFLHSSVVREKWKSISDLPRLRKDLVVSIIVGGVISASIIVTSAAAFHARGISLESGGQLAGQLEPLFGPMTKILFGIGFFSAGLSSALTAPYAASFAAAGVFGWDDGRRGVRFNLVAAGVILTGLVVALLKLKPLPVIVFAQVANGLILPVASIFLLVMLNNRKMVGASANSRLQNAAGFLVVAVVSLLGLWNIIRAALLN